ncbi:ROK family protein, partial [Streptomyces albogriseolus]|uniref:ROK family protein n=1 Tax=Streptomyces albogriseolus TaxID=1887 RepID=UPI0036C0B0DD
MKHVIALDVGGTGMKAALVGADGELLHQARRPTGRERGPDAVVEGILGFAAELHAHGARAHGEPASAAGVAVPGIVDEAEGVGPPPPPPPGGGGAPGRPAAPPRGGGAPGPR